MKWLRLAFQLFLSLIWLGMALVFLFGPVKPEERWFCLFIGCGLVGIALRQGFDGYRTFKNCKR